MLQDYDLMRWFHFFLSKYDFTYYFSYYFYYKKLHNAVSKRLTFSHGNSEHLECCCKCQD